MSSSTSQIIGRSPQATAAMRAAAKTVPPAVVIMARAPRRGSVRVALEDELGPDLCVKLQTLLLLQAVTWATSLSPRAIHVAYEPADAGQELRKLLGDDKLGAEVNLFPQNGEGISGRLVDAMVRATGHDPGPVVIVWPDLPELKQSHAEAVLHDLRAGADIVVGPVMDGGFYLLALAHQQPQIANLPESAWRGSDSLAALTAAAGTAELSIGLLGAERALRRPADLRALMADPIFTGPVAKLLGW